VSLKGLAAKMNWLAVNRKSQSNSDFDFDFEVSQFRVMSLESTVAVDG
jgi:hypothetical protein